jgi:hypothetical protein
MKSGMMLTSYAPNLIADSGMTLATFKPFPNKTDQLGPPTRYAEEI